MKKIVWRTPVCWDTKGRKYTLSNYLCNNKGTIISLDYNHTGKPKEMGKTVDKNGYIFNTYRSDEFGTTVLRRCRIITCTFLGEPDDFSLQVNHKDEVKTNDYIHLNPDGTVNPELSNLEWCTSKENNNWGTRNKRIANKNKLVDKTYCKQPVRVLKYVGTYPSLTEAAEALGINSISNISATFAGEQNYVNGYRFEKIDLSSFES